MRSGPSIHVGHTTTHMPKNPRTFETGKVVTFGEKTMDWSPMAMNGLSFLQSASLLFSASPVEKREEEEREAMWRKETDEVLIWFVFQYFFFGLLSPFLSLSLRHWLGFPSLISYPFLFKTTLSCPPGGEEGISLVHTSSTIKISLSLLRLYLSCPPGGPTYPSRHPFIWKKKKRDLLFCCLGTTYLTIIPHGKLAEHFYFHAPTN